MRLSRWRTSVFVAVPALVLGLPSLSACQGAGSAEPPEAPAGRPSALGAGSRVLMIGNSLTSVNDVPAMVEALADAAGLDWEVEAITTGGASLQDHWLRESTVERVRQGSWDAVVLQQGPSSLPDSRINLRHWAAVIDAEVRAAGGRSSLYEVWPEQARLEVFDRVRDSYALAAVDVGGNFLPAGEAWREAWRRDPGAPLYGPDAFHPSLAGSYAAALAIYAGLSGRTPIGLPAALQIEGGGTLSVPPPLADLLQSAALQAVEDYRDYRPPDLP